MPDYLETAIAAAHAAGALQRKRWRMGSKIREVTRHDTKLEIDVECEEIIRGILRQTFPDHAILGEEEGGQLAEDCPTWVIDPLDGTVNFSRQLPHFCTSIALYWEERPVVGVVYDPLVDELFTAEEGCGAFLNRETIHTSEVAELAAANIAIGFSKSVAGTAGMLKEVNELAHAVKKIRIMGAAALDLAYVAAGRFDGFLEYGLRTWDIAAGALLVREAGGRVELTPSGELRWDVRADNGKLL